MQWNILTQIAPGIIIKDVFIGWADFTEQVAFSVKVKEHPKTQEQYYKTTLNEGKTSIESATLEVGGSSTLKYVKRSVW